MILTERKAPYDLLYMDALKRRMTLGAKEERTLSVLQSGFDGEQHYDRVLEAAGHESLIVFRDIYVKAGEAVTQFDALIIEGNCVTVHEIKNYSGFYSYVEGQWFSGKFEVTEDAISQLKRAMGKLKKVRYDSQMDFDVQGKIIFPNVDLQFDCDDGRARSMIIMRNQLQQYLRSFRPSGISDQSKRIARVIHKNIIDNPYFDKCADMDVLKKGLYCFSCGGFDLEAGRYYMYCPGCGSRESKENHVIRAFSDFQSLFRHEKMTRNGVETLIDGQVSQKTLARMFSKYCEKYGDGPKTFYKFKYYDYEDAVKKRTGSARYRRNTSI